MRPIHSNIVNTTQPESSSPQSRTTLVTFLGLLLVLLVVALGMVLPYLLALTMGGILALLSYPLFQRLRQHNFGPKWASALVTIGIVLVIIAPISIFIALAIKQGISIGQSLANNETLSFQSLLDRAGRWFPIQTIIGSPEIFEKQARGWLQGAGKAATAAILGIATNVPKIILQLVLATIACFFFLIDGSRFVSWMTDKIPIDPDVGSRVVSSFQNTAFSVIWATFAAASVQSTILLVGFLALGIPGAFLAMGAAFIFAWIPILGSGPVWLAGTFYLYSQGLSLKATLMIIIGVITGLVDNFVRPMVLKGRGNLHPLVSLVAIFGGIRMFGIMGIFIGPILAAVLISLLQIWPAVGQRFGLIPHPIQAQKDALKRAV